MSDNDESNANDNNSLASNIDNHSNTVVTIVIKVELNDALVVSKNCNIASHNDKITTTISTTQMTPLLIVIVTLETLLLTITNLLVIITIYLHQA